MFSGIKPIGVAPPSGISSYNSSVSAAEHTKISQQNYDQFLCGAQPGGEEGRIRETVNQISQKARIRPTNHELAHLQQQIKNGTYQPNAREIAARMLMSSVQED